MQYARYTIRAWPVPDTGTDQATQVLLPSDLAVDTVNGGIVEPYQYLGTEPAICHAGPVYTKGRLLCDRGVLCGDSMQRASCSIINVCPLDTDYAEEISPALLVVRTAGEKIFGAVPRPTRVSRNSHNRDVPHLC